MRRGWGDWTVSGKPKHPYSCPSCGFKFETCGIPIECPKCHEPFPIGKSLYGANVSRAERAFKIVKQKEEAMRVAERIT